MKAKIRGMINKKISGLSDEEFYHKCQKIIKRLKGLECFEKRKNLCIYVSKKREITTHGLIKEILLKKNVLVPYIDGDEMKIMPIKSFKELSEGKFMILEPKTKKEFLGKIDLVIVPGIAFDRSCNRLGRGKGYYDKFLKKIDVEKIGLALEEQIIKEVPCEQHDIPLDIIITEKRMIINKNGNNFRW